MKKRLYVVLYLWSGEKEYHSEVFTAKRHANAWMNGSQYGVIAERYQFTIPRIGCAF